MTSLDTSMIWSKLLQHSRRYASLTLKQLHVQYDGQDLIFPEGTVQNSHQDWKQQLSRYIQEEKITSLTIEYQGPDLWILKKPKQEKKLQYWLTKQLPPGKRLNDYQVSFHALKDHDLIGLIPKSACNAFFELSERLGLLECAIFGIPLEFAPETGSSLLSYRKINWYIERNRARIKRIIPIIPGEPPFGNLVSCPKVEPGRGKPLFQWSDPKQNARQKAYRDRVFLKRASLAAVLVMGLAWVFLFLGERYWDIKLNKVTEALSKRELHQKQYMATFREYESLVEELEGLTSVMEDRVPVAVVFRQIMRQCPHSFIFTNMLYQHETQSFIVSGYAPNQAQMTYYLNQLKKTYPHTAMDLVLFRLQAEPINDELLQTKGVVNGMYAFNISLRWKS